LVRKKKKRKKKKQAKQWFSFGSKSAAKKKAKAGPGRHIFFTVFGLLCFLAVASAVFVLLDRYVQQITASNKVGSLELLDKPAWFNAQLVQKVHSAAGGSEFRLDESTARTVAQNLQSMTWLYAVKVRTTSNSVRVSAKYRRPVGLVKRSRTTYYIDSDAVVLQYLPIEDLTVVEIKGFSARSIPPAGDMMAGDDIAAAIKLLAVLETMDQISTPLAPLRYVEASEKEKVAMLYEFYKDHSTIQGIVKYIELRNPQEAIPRPTAP
jgi:hypothetical protein